MAKQLVLVSHGSFCEALKASTEMIMGPQESITAVPLLASEGAEDFRQKFLASIEGMEDVVVFADLMGGTPCNVLSRLLMEGYPFELYAGMNMPMVVGFINANLLEETIDFKVFAKDNIHHVNPLLNQLAEDDED
ncbi:UNVERIFIED_CONTAM: PTS sugar transporter subunit IIA [Streptococcus canis]|uniref:PTS sugar transporter subunit IIA n=1 Tax=Streptococcus canis TaxID=1329 RepID=A0AAE4Q7M7_STRCB|nr:PTS sugar transporter subunit IIA [Streptococcus canis]MDV5976797.1 PTS sugar transporter subunit IIA [Streptococcus canis]